MGTDAPDEDRRTHIGVWAQNNGFELLDDRDQEAERLPVFVVQGTVDRDVHNVCLGLWEDTEVVLFDLRRGSGPERIDSTGATIAHPYGLPTTLILHPETAKSELMLSSLPVIDDQSIEDAYEVRSEHPTFARALLTGELAQWLLTSRDQAPPMSYELGHDWLLGYAPSVPTELLPELLDGVLGFRDRITPEVLTTYGR